MDNILKFPIELKPYYFNTLTLKDNLDVDLFINCPLSFMRLYNLLNCNIGGVNNDYYYCIDSPKIKCCSMFGLLMVEQFNIY